MSMHDCYAHLRATLGKVTSKVRIGALLCNEGVTNCMTLAILSFLSLCIDFAAIKLLV